MTDLNDIVKAVKALKQDDIHHVISEAKKELLGRIEVDQLDVYVVDGTHMGPEFASFDYTEAMEALLAHVEASKYDVGQHRFRISERARTKADADALIEEINRGRTLEEYIKEQEYARESEKKGWELQRSNIEAKKSQD